MDHSIRDHEERLQAALDEAASQRDSFFSIINAASDGLLLLDTSQRVVAANQRCAELLGLEYGRLLGGSTGELAADLERRCEDPSLYRARLGRHFEREAEPYQDRLTLLEPRKRVLRRASQPAWSHRRVAGRVFTYTDITVEVELDQMKSDFVSMASHELRTPLTSIHGALQLAHAGAADRLTGEELELLEISIASTERLSRLVNRMLDLSKLEAGRMPVQSRPLNASMLLDEVTRSMQGHAATKRMTIDCECEPAIQGVRGDPDLLVRVLTNLVSNALKYSPDGSRIRVSARKASAPAVGIEFGVEDQGPGIAPEHREQLFRPFARVGPQAQDRRDGTGLGLSISRAIVEQHGGTIWVEAGIGGVGSRFAFTVPFQPARPRPAVA